MKTEHWILVGEVHALDDPIRSGYQREMKRERGVDGQTEDDEFNDSFVRIEEPRFRALVQRSPSVLMMRAIEMMNCHLSRALSTA